MVARATGATLAVLVLLATSAAAQPGEESLRCGTTIVRAGVSMSDVLYDCGPPTVRGPTRHLVTFHKVDELTWQQVVTDVEPWLYDLGPNRFVRVLTFVNGYLWTIELGGYGAP